MSLEDLQRSLRAAEGAIVVSKSIAGNSLLLNLAHARRAKPCATLWLDPAWRYERGAKAVVASGDFPVVEQATDRTEFDRVCRLVDDLEGAIVVDARVSLPSHDLTLTLSGSRSIIGFALSVEDAEWPSWYLHDLERQLVYNVTVQGVSVETSAA